MKMISMRTPIRMYTDKDAQAIAGMGKEMTERGLEAHARRDYRSMESCSMCADMYFAFAELCEKTNYLTLQKK